MQSNLKNTVVRKEESPKNGRGDFPKNLDSKNGIHIMKERKYMKLQRLTKEFIQKKNRRERERLPICESRRSLKNSDKNFQDTN